MYIHAKTLVTLGSTRRVKYACAPGLNEEVFDVGYETEYVAKPQNAKVTGKGNSHLGLHTRYLQNNITEISVPYPTPTAPRITLCTIHRATCPATATATARRYPHPSRIYSASMLLSSTRCVSTTPSESSEAR